MDMMKKFYRNRYTSFIKTLAEQKSRKLQAEESQAKKDAEAKKKEKIKSKVIDAS
jgi:membrane-bound ClpP family serine protease